jgi:hypothetical protein
MWSISYLYGYVSFLVSRESMTKTLQQLATHMPYMVQHESPQAIEQDNSTQLILTFIRTNKQPTSTVVS